MHQEKGMINYKDAKQKRWEIYRKLNRQNLVTKTSRWKKADKDDSYCMTCTLTGPRHTGGEQNGSRRGRCMGGENELKLSFRCLKTKERCPLRVDTQASCSVERLRSIFWWNLNMNVLVKKQNNKNIHNI